MNGGVQHEWHSFRVPIVWPGQVDIAVVPEECSEDFTVGKRFSKCRVGTIWIVLTVRDPFFRTISLVRVCNMYEDTLGVGYKRFRLWFPHKTSSVVDFENFPAYKAGNV